MARSKYEIYAHKELEAQGYLVDWKVRPSRAGKFPVDFFNLFDLLAVRSGDPLRFISVKGRAGVPGEHRQAIEEFWLPESCQKEIWTYRSKSKVKKEVIE